jgi:AhpD family alkylhydroperoxidase
MPTVGHGCGCPVCCVRCQFNSFRERITTDASYSRPLRRRRTRRLPGGATAVEGAGRQSPQHLRRDGALPVVLAAYTGIQQAIAEHGSFDARTREAIALAVGAADNCGYCQPAHAGGARQGGWSLDEMVALAAVNRQIVSNIGEVDENTWQQALDAGWTVEELTELFAHVSVNIFTNYFNHYAHTDLDIPAAPGL